MNYARTRHAVLFWVWVALLVVYTVGGGWLLYKGAREQAAHYQPISIVGQVDAGLEKSIALNE